MRAKVQRFAMLPKHLYKFIIPTSLTRRYRLWQYNRTFETTKDIREDEDNGIYYFLGNFHQHMSHVLPLYKFIGGTIVVLSKSAQKEVETLGARCIYIDDYEDVWLHLDKKIQKTIDYLNHNAKVVILHDAFYWNDISLKAPTLWLNHGTGIVKGIIWDEERFKELNKLTFIATLGELAKKMLDDKVAPQKMKKLSPARVDEIVNVSISKRSQHIKTKKILNIPVKKTVITYMPTYWGPSSVEDTGLEIVKNFPEDKILIFWPHPQTPREIIKKYQKAISRRPNIIDAQKIGDISITDVYAVTDKFIADHSSSVVVDIMMLGKQILFSFGKGDNYDHTVNQSPLKNFVKNSTSITADNVNNLGILLSLNDKLITKIRRRALVYQFSWFPNGGATVNIIKAIDKWCP